MVERRCNRGGNQPLFLSVGGSSALTPKAKVLMTVRLKPMRLGVTDTRRVRTPTRTLNPSLRYRRISPLGGPL